MANQQTIDKILNKQFKKTAFAGYDTIDVDSFFDLVIDYLKANDKTVEEFKIQLDKVMKDNSDLIKEINNLKQQITQKQQLIIRYESEGYGNVMANKRLTSIEQAVRELKEKSNGK